MLISKHRSSLNMKVLTSNVFEKRGPEKTKVKSLLIFMLLLSNQRCIFSSISDTMYIVLCKTKRRCTYLLNQWYVGYIKTKLHKKAIVLKQFSWKYILIYIHIYILFFRSMVVFLSIFIPCHVLVIYSFFSINMVSKLQYTVSHSCDILPIFTALI